MCNIVHTCILKKIYCSCKLYSCKFCTARVFLFLADHEAIQFTNIHKIQRYLCADEAKGLLVPYVLVAVRRELDSLEPRRCNNGLRAGAGWAECDGSARQAYLA